MFKYFKKRSEQKEVVRLLLQVQKELSFANEPKEIKQLIDFFKITSRLQDEMRGKKFLSDDVKKFILNTGRQDSRGWNHTPVGKETQIYHITIVPKIPWDEYFTSKSLDELVNHPTNYCMAFGLVKEGAVLNDGQFFFQAFVKGFIQSNKVFLDQIIQKEVLI